MTLGLLCTYTLKVEDHLSDHTFSWLAKAFPNASHDTLKMTKKRVWSLLDLNLCNTTVVSTAVFTLLDYMRTSLNVPTARKQIQYQWKAAQTFQLPPCHTLVKSHVGKLCTCDKDVLSSRVYAWAWFFKDIFDRSHYQSLLNTTVPTDGAYPFFFFSDECDIALGLLTDGFAPFKRHDVTRWTIILFNYNLPPEICFLKKYCIHIATVLGPK